MNARHRGDSTEAGTALDAEGPLRRWARRRREVAREERGAAEARRGGAPDERADISDPVDEASRPAEAEEKVLTDEDMPPLESLDESSDYSGFLSRGLARDCGGVRCASCSRAPCSTCPTGSTTTTTTSRRFAALGDIVTADMRHQAEVEAERARQAEAESESASQARDAPERVDGDDVAHLGDDGESLADDSPGPDGAAQAPTRIAEFEETQAHATEPAFEDVHADLRGACDSVREPASGLANAKDPDPDPDPGPPSDPERT